ncbi:MAG: hypothetical protein H3C35_10920 [Bacteroidetes bacterium]|nr:hypothetical protein [Bacteroidota bacterium]
MKTNFLSKKFLLLTAAAIFITLLFGYGIKILIDRWTTEIVQTNTELTLETVSRIRTSSSSLIDSLNNKHLFSIESLEKRELQKVDKLFSAVTASQARSVNGMEGGFYFITMDEMIGYSWPTAPEPMPAYGPAPRSYPIIKEQILETIKEKKPLLQFHSFDFAVFPLSTEPIYVNNKIIGAAWARIHIERELPGSQLLKVLNFTAIVAIGALGAALILLWIRKKHINEIRAGLERVRLDQTYRLPLEGGVFSAIASSINSMVDALLTEQQKRQQLERELHQQDKMATLGKLIAGVAHEVKTPLAVIKTRIQMWQRDIQQKKSGDELQKIFSNDSMELVVKEINRLSNLVKRLLIFTKPSKNKFQAHNVNDMIRQTVLVIQQEAENKDISVTLHCAENLPLIEFDHQALEQVCINLCVNAMESIQSSGTLDIYTEITDKKDFISLLFKDSGKGVPEELQQKIFDPFFTTKENGVGLGLSISYEIIKAHNGKIEFLPVHAGGGAICRILLPVSNKRDK